jgi:hypothetical protein
LYFTIYRPFHQFIGFYQSDYPFYKGQLIEISFASPHSPSEPIIVIQKKSLSEEQLSIPFSLQNEIKIEVPSCDMQSKEIFAVYAQKQGFCSANHRVTLLLLEDIEAESKVSNGYPNPNTGLWQCYNPLGSNVTLCESDRTTILQFKCEVCPKPRLRLPMEVVEHIPKLSKSKGS